MLPILAVGCSRTKYRRAADRDAYRIVQEKSACLVEQVPDDYTIKPDPRSRFYDPTNPDCPQLPVPRSVLNSYAIPPLNSDASHSTPKPTASPFSQIIPEEVEETPPATLNDQAVSQASFQNEAVIPVGNDRDPVANRKSGDGPASAQSSQEPMQSNSVPIIKVTIPAQAWDVLPTNCLERMLEFETLQQEYAQTFADSGQEPASAQVRRLTLANLMELATINSREYQTRKEALFRTALTLTRQRYQFDLNPSPFGNGTAADYRHLRTNGVTENRLATPSGVGVEKTLATGGEFLARFANSVVLTFNGPSGFATDIGSEMIFDFQQTVFQRDVRFETLTRAEREVIYATREYLRFRRQMFSRRFQSVLQPTLELPNH